MNKRVGLFLYRNHTCKVLWWQIKKIKTSHINHSCALQKALTKEKKFASFWLKHQIPKTKDNFFLFNLKETVFPAGDHCNWLSLTHQTYMKYHLLLWEHCQNSLINTKRDLSHRTCPLLLPQGPLVRSLYLNLLMRFLCLSLLLIFVFRRVHCR